MSARSKYHYEWAAYTDNLDYGRVLIDQGAWIPETKLVQTTAPLDFSFVYIRVFEYRHKVGVL